MTLRLLTLPFLVCLATLTFAQTGIGINQKEA